MRPTGAAPAGSTAIAAAAATVATEGPLWALVGVMGLPSASVLATCNGGGTAKPIVGAVIGPVAVVVAVVAVGAWAGGTLAALAAMGAGENTDDADAKRCVIMTVKATLHTARSSGVHTSCAVLR